MICPNKKCRMEIDDDSKFCDQCGSEILICAQCGAAGTGKYCAKDRGIMESRKKVTAPPPGTPPVENAAIVKPRVNQEQAASVQRQESHGATARPPVTDELIIVHSTGFELKIRDNDLLGRGEGPHSEQLGSFKYISRKHAVIFMKTGSWYIKDTGSMNKSKVNETILEPEKEFMIKTGDRIMLADQEFIVK